MRAARPARTIEHVFASDPAELVRNGIATLAREDRRSWPAAAHTERLLELRELQERLDAEMVRCVAGWDAAAAWAEGTALGPKSWLASRARMTRPEADRLLKSARLVRDHEGTAAALAAGEVTARQVESLAVAARQRGDAYAQHETTLLHAARTVEVQDFPRFTCRWRELADDERSARDAAFAFERRGFTLSPTIGGGVLSGFAPASSRGGSDAWSACATTTASSPVAGSRRSGATCTTSVTGATAARRTSTTWRCSVVATTWPATKAAGSSPVVPMASPWRRDRAGSQGRGSARPARAASCDGAGRVSAQTSTAARRSS